MHTGGAPATVGHGAWLTSDDVLSPVNVTSAPQGDDVCLHIYSIPGVVSQRVASGLENFSLRYSAVHGYLSTAVCVFGLMANTANILVLTRKNMISPTNTILLWLAVADLLTMASYLPFAIHFYIMKDPLLDTFSSRSYGWIIFLMFHASFSIVCHTVAIWLTIALAIFRYIYICMPTKGSIYCNLRRAKMVIFTVYALTIIVCIPNCISNRFSQRVDKVLVSTNPRFPALNNSNVSYSIPNTVSGSGKQVAAVPALLSHSALPFTTASSSQEPQQDSATSGESGDIWHEEIWNDDLIYYPIQWKDSLLADIIMQINYWIQAVMIKLLPCIMLTTLTVLLIHAMHKAYRRRMQLKSQGRKADADRHGEHNRTTRMLLAVVVLFTITELPQGILSLMNNFFLCFRELVYNRLGDLLDAMALMNNAVNFLLYCVMSTQFRHTFMAIFCRLCALYRPGWLTHNVLGQGATTARHPNNSNHGVTAV